ncbi:MAG: hypothetical protein Q4E69_03960 [Bacilli bacterium]|nr:hypothetical protein [Bacilli bacterium]
MSRNFYSSYIDCNNILKLEKEDRNILAYNLSEGNDDLRKLLLNCWNNNIKTFSCCKGHDEYYPQFAFELDTNQSITLANALLNHQDDFTFCINSQNFGLFEDKLAQTLTFSVGDINAKSKNSTDLFTKINNIIMYNDFKNEELNELLVHALNIDKLFKNTHISATLTIQDNNLNLNIRNYENYVPSIKRSSTTLNHYIIEDLKHKKLNAYIDQDLSKEELVDFLDTFYYDYKEKSRKK